MMREPVYVAIHVPEFPAQALLRFRPGLKHQAVAVLKGTPPLQQVCSLNGLARGMGVQTGMTRAQLDSYPTLQVLAASALEESGARDALMEVAAVFTPSIEPFPVTGSEYVMVLDMTGTHWMLGSMASAAQRILVAFQASEFSVRLVASSNVHVALCLASVSRQKPMIVPRGEEAKALSSLPLSALPLSQHMTETLALWGLHTCGQFAALPVTDVVTRLGKEGRRLHAMARGEEPHMLVPVEPVFSLEEKIEFDTPVEQMDSLLFVLRPILDQLVRRAQSRSYSVASVTSCLLLDGGGEHKRCIRPALPTVECVALLKLLQLNLQTHPPGAGVVAVRLTAEPGDRLPVQAGLFAPQLPESMRLDVTLARIVAIVGEQRVGRIRLLDTQSLQNFAMEPFRVVEAALHNDSLRKQPASAVRRCRPPLTLRVHAQHKQHAQHPLSFYLHGRLYTVAEAFGPWRHSGSWWSSEVWSHEEWDVHAHTQNNTVVSALLCVLRRDVLRNAWTLEALYD